jgi:hypothetical protein
MHFFQAFLLDMNRSSFKAPHLFILALIFISPCVLAQVQVKGKVVDKELNEPLVFVTVVIEGANKGTITDIDGEFTLEVPSPDAMIQFRYMGFKPLSITASELINNPVIYLLPEVKTLREVTFLAGENPAHPIIRKLIANKPLLDPAKQDAYTFDAYNKFIIGTDIIPDIDESDSVQQNIIGLLNKNYLFTMESITARTYRKNRPVQDKVLANRVSGFKAPQFTTIASSFQDLGFYNDFITILNISYLNPVSKNSFDNYYFDLVDSIRDDQERKIYIINFEPRKNTFNGLAGTLHVDAEEFALSTVIAETREFSNMYQNFMAGTSEYASKAGDQYDFENYLTINFRIQQHYSRFGTVRWFPDQLKVDFFFGEFAKKNAPSIPLMGIGKSYLKNINLNPDLNGVSFSRTILTYDPKANERDSSFWSAYRPERPSMKEVNTYQMVDSIMEKTKLERILNVSSGLLEKKIPLGLVDINLNRAFDINRYEGFRAGLGLSTSERLSGFFELGGYWAYGFKDKADKYGGFLNLHLLPEKRLTAFARYSEDVQQFGQLSFYQYKQLPLESENFYRFFINKMNTVEQREAGFKWYWLRYLDTELSFRQRSVTVNNEYAYLVTPDDASGATQFDFSEVKLSLGYNPNVHYIQTFNKLIRTPRSDFYAGANYYRGFRQSGEGDFEYNKFELMIQKRFKTRSLGQPTFTFMGGWIDNSLPATEMFAIRGSEIRGGLDVSNSFRTMGLNEFVADQFASIFYQHKLIQFVISQKFSKPQVFLIGAWGYGELTNESRHVDPYFKGLNDNYYEAGVLIRRLLISGTTAIGGGVYTRLGEYAFEKTSDNIFFKLDIFFDSGE